MCIIASLNYRLRLLMDWVTAESGLVIIKIPSLLLLVFILLGQLLWHPIKEATQLRLKRDGVLFSKR
jgi:hypothetical protein